MPCIYSAVVVGKTEHYLSAYIYFGSKRHSTPARNIGVMCDKKINFRQHIYDACRGRFFFIMFMSAFAFVGICLFLILIIVTVIPHYTILLGCHETSTRVGLLLPIKGIYRLPHTSHGTANQPFGLCVLIVLCVFQEWYFQSR